MDLDFTDEQEMLRETVRGVCEKHASLDGRPRGRGRPDRLPGLVLEAARRPRPARAHDLRGVRRLGHDDARRGGRLRGARARARAVAALRQLGAERGRARAGGERRATPRVAAAHRRRRRDPHARLARARPRLRPARRATARRGRRRRVRADGHQAARALRRGGRRATSCSRAPAPPSRHRPLPRRPATRPASRARSR